MPDATRRAFAPAKINIALHVTGRRADGYHLLDTLVVFADAGDQLEIEPAAQDRLSIVGRFGEGLPTGADNLVARARDLLRASEAPDAPPVSITLDKSLPVASGIGGGSSDAAATLKALASLWKLDMDPSRLAALALPLGADLPMCLAARPLVARGIGDAVEPLDAFPALQLVLVNPGVAVSTPSVFAALASRDNAPLPSLPARPTADETASWLARTRNDLEQAALTLAPPIGDALLALDRHGARLSRMSGSGAICFGLFASRADAEATAYAIAQAEPDWFVTATTTGGSGDRT